VCIGLKKIPEREKLLLLVFVLPVNTLIMIASLLIVLLGLKHQLLNCVVGNMLTLGMFGRTVNILRESQEHLAPIC